MRGQQTRCPVCHRLLIYPAGAATILCPACNHLLVTQPHSQRSIQSACQFCAYLIQHPLGLTILQCPMCANPTRTSPLLSYICQGCSLSLIYSSSIPCVVCPMCSRIEPPIPSSVPSVQSLLPLQHHAPPKPPPQLPRRITWLPSTPVRQIPSRYTQVQRQTQYPRAPIVQRQRPTSAPVTTSSTSTPTPTSTPPLPATTTTTTTTETETTSTITTKPTSTPTNITADQRNQTLSTDSQNHGANGDNMATQNSQHNSPHQPTSDK